MAKRISRCPSCDSELSISELSCKTCSLTIRGEFNSCRFCNLAPEHLTYLETFLLCEGNLSRMEKILNLSYPTLRNKLTAALQALGGALEVPGTNHDSENTLETLLDKRRYLLERVATGMISAENAALALKELN